MARFTFARLDMKDEVNVHAEITGLNRDFERRFPHCTVQIVDTGDYGQSSQWVTVEMESLDAPSPECIEWYVAELAARRIAPQSIPEPVDFDVLVSQASFDRRHV